VKILLLSDIHAHNFQDFAKPGFGMNSRLNYTLEAVTAALQYAVDNKITTVFVLGDIFHSHSKLDVDVIHHTYDAFADFAQDVDFTFLVGNHDQSANDGSVHSVSIFKELGRVVEHPTWFCVGDQKVFAMPYMRDTEQWKSHVKWQDEQDVNYDIFLFHQGLNEGQIGAFNISLKGNIGLGDLPDTKFRFGGHYHKHQKLDDRTWYVGSPIQHNFGERDETKGFVVLDTDDGTVTQVPLDSPRFFQFNSVEDFKRSGVNEQYHYVKIVIDGSQNLVDIPGVKVIYTNKNEATDVEAPQPQHLDDTALMREYISRVNSELDVDKLLAIGQDVLEEVKYE
jgi:DNA repair exonuclease SbcCD nuclease subunit